VVNATSRPLYPRYPLYRRLGGPQGQSGRVWKISPSPEFDSRTVQSVSIRYTDWAIPTHQGSPVPLLKFQMAPRLKLLSSGSKKKEPRYVCLSEPKVSCSQRVWAEVSSSAPHLLQKTLLVSPIKSRSLFRVLCPARSITTLDCALSKNKSLVFAGGLWLEINSSACLWGG
jgi:hypothetical protein